MKKLWQAFLRLIGRKASTTPSGTDTAPKPDGIVNPRPTASEAGLQSQEVKWKVDNDGKGGTGIARTVVRWPSFITRAFDPNGNNSYCSIDGATAKFYKIDTEKGNARASYTIDRKASTFPANCQVYLVVNSVNVAGFCKADPKLYIDFALPEKMTDIVR